MFWYKISISVFLLMLVYPWNKWQLGPKLRKSFCCGVKLGNAECPFIVSLPGPIWPGVVAPDKVLSVGQIELFDI